MDEYRVLLVDDETDFLVILTKRLQRRTLDVTSVTTGEDALRYLADHAVDVVVLDIRLPGMDGVQTLKHIKRRFPDVQVIMLSGFADREMAAHVLQCGAFGYLMKPVELTELVDKIRKAMAPRRHPHQT